VTTTLRTVNNREIGAGGSVSANATNHSFEIRQRLKRTQNNRYFTAICICCLRDRKAGFPIFVSYIQQRGCSGSSWESVTKALPRAEN
jgi:hypothetical protein